MAPRVAVTENDDEFGAGDFVGVSEGAEDVVVNHVAREADAENVARGRGRRYARRRCEKSMQLTMLAMGC